MAVIEGMWCHRDASVEVKQNYEGGVSVWCSSKKMYNFNPEGYLGRVLHVRAFSSFSRHLYVCVEGLCWQLPLASLLVEILSFVFVRVWLGFKRERDEWILI